MAKNKKKKGNFLNSSIAKKKEDSSGNYYLSGNEAKHLSIDKTENKAHSNLKYYDSNFECFSEWQTIELKELSSFFNRLNQTTWPDIYKSGGKGGNKSGFGYTPHKDTSVLPNQNLITKLDQGLTYFELRVTQKARVHGFRIKQSFFLIWLDRNHQVYPA